MVRDETQSRDVRKGKGTEQSKSNFKSGELGPDGNQTIGVVQTKKASKKSVKKTARVSTNKKKAETP